MDKSAAITRIRKLLTDGDIESALQLLIENLEADRGKFRELSNRAIQAKAQLEKIQRDELQGVVSFENTKISYNQITRQIISLLDEWEDPGQASPKAKRGFSPKMILVAATLFALVLVIGFILFKRANGSGANSGCPAFDRASAFNILVLPYYTIASSGEKPISPHDLIVRRLERFKLEAGKKLKTDVRSKEDPPPKSDREAIQSGEDCLAKLVIWGEIDHPSSGASGNRVFVNTNYQYLMPEESFSFTKFNLNDDQGIERQSALSNIPTRGFFLDTISNLSSIITEGKLTEELENQIRLLFGVAAMQSGDPEAAIDLLQQAVATDSSSILLKEMALAESFLQKNDQRSAIAAYDRVLEEHSNYWFAANNRALLYFQEGDYFSSLQMLNQQLAQTPDNPNVLAVRASVLIKTKQYKEAREDLEKARRLAPDDESIERKINLLEKKKKEEDNRRVRARKVLRTDRTNIKAMTELAEANRNLGDYEQASIIAQRILNLDRSNVNAIALKIETDAKLASDNTDAQIRSVNRAINNLDPSIKEAVLRERPALRIISGIREK